MRANLGKRRCAVNRLAAPIACGHHRAMDDPPGQIRPDIETVMAFDPLTGLVDLEQHLLALKDRAGTLGYRFDRHDVRNELQAATFRLRASHSVRLLLSPSGAVAIEISPVI